ncbi:hypothetical protein CYY_002113 [Polysphondylium violaceum]|uniref:Uncharacterized protein n=1 Tax=Polysphondylium violaceum TaxID=133409 RepID=A0A8J4V772_9MYCE|nr:hypothetical protein CYY_002113 [Polysphondylium violaceum]
MSGSADSAYDQLCSNFKLDINDKNQDMDLGGGSGGSEIRGYGSSCVVSDWEDGGSCGGAGFSPVHDQSFEVFNHRQNHNHKLDHIYKTCPYDYCGKVVYGGSENMTLHMQSHNTQQSHIEFYKSRAIQKLKNKYGNLALEKDYNDNYVCFFYGCQSRMKNHFDRHIAKHEARNDPLSIYLSPPIVPPNTNIHILKNANFFVNHFMGSGGV